MRIHEKKDSTSPHYRVECNYGIGRALGEDPDDVASSDSVLHEQGAECIRASAELVVSDVHTLLADRDSTPLPCAASDDRIERRESVRPRTQRGDQILHFVRREDAEVTERTGSRVEEPLE